MLLPIGDVQLGAQGCDIALLKETIKRGKDIGAYFLGMGDMVDVASPSNRERLQQAVLYDSVYDALEANAQDRVDELMGIFKGTEGRWLGLLSGHHYYQFSGGETTDMRLARLLKAPFLGDCAFVRLVFTYAHETRPITIWCHHGYGSGQTLAAPLNKVEKIMNTFEADVYLIGHYHRTVAAPSPRLYMTNRRPHRVKEKVRFAACTGGFLKGYEAGSKVMGKVGGSYVEKRMLPPLARGGIAVRFFPEWRTLRKGSGKANDSEGAIRISIEV